MKFRHHLKTCLFKLFELIVAVECGYVRNGTNTVPVLQSEILHYGESYTYECVGDFWTHDPLTVTCQADGTMSSYAPTCTCLT